MSESPGVTLKPSENGIQGLAMMAPVVGLPFGLHALSGAVVVGAFLAPFAVPVTVPFLISLASKSDVNALAGKLFPSARSTSEVEAVPVRIKGQTSVSAEAMNAEADA